MKRKLTITALLITTIAIAQAQVTEVACCDPVTVATGHDHKVAVEGSGHHGPASLSSEQFNTLLAPYLTTQKALASDDLDATRKGGASMSNVIKRFPGDRNMLLAEAAGMIAAAKDIKTARDAFLPISEVLIATAKTFDLTGSKIYLAHCPMAFDNKGGSWLQDEPVLANPYWGAMMLRCGTIKPLSSK